MSKNNQKISYSSTQGELFSLSPVQGKQIVVDFDSPEVSSLGGLLLMRESKREVVIRSSLSSCLRETERSINPPYLQRDDDSARFSNSFRL